MTTDPVHLAGAIDEASTQQARAAWQAWHKQREADLQRPHDWLSVSDLHWVTGSGQQLPGVPGRWSATGQHLQAAFEPGDEVRLLDDDTPAAEAATGTVTIEVGEAGSSRFALAGQVLIEVIRRGGFYALRLRDPQAPTRTAFAGVPVFDYDPAWVLSARLEAFDEPRSERVGSAAPGLHQVATTVGTVTLPIAGRDQSLTATELGDRWFVSFSDATSGEQTSAWRLVPVHITGPGAGAVDFNRAVNMPYAFTDFGTCPAPVAGNHLHAAVRAGERTPRGRTGVPPVSGGPTALPGALPGAARTKPSATI